MKKQIFLSLISSLLMLGDSQAGKPMPYPADINAGSPMFMLGISVEFGDTVEKADVGLTAKVISSNRPNTFVFGGGLSYFPWSKDLTGQIGADISGGYNFTNVGALIGYDLLRYKPQISMGYVPTETNFKQCSNGYTLTDSNCTPIPLLPPPP